MFLVFLLLYLTEAHDERSYEMEYWSENFDENKNCEREQEMKELMIDHHDHQASELGKCARADLQDQSSPLSLVEIQRGSALIGQNNS